MECLDSCGSLRGNLPERKDAVSTVLDENYQVPAHVHVLCRDLKFENNFFFASNLENVKYTVNTTHLKMETSEYWTFWCLVFRWSVFSDARSIIIAIADKLIRYSYQHLNSAQVVQYHSGTRQHLSVQYSDAIWLKDHTRQVHYPGPHCIVGIQKRLRIWTPLEFQARFWIFRTPFQTI